MLLRKKTIEELLDMQQELHLSTEEEENGSLYKLISLYEELYRKIAADRNSEYAPSLENIKKKLISYLVRYGTYLKTEYQKDDYTAKSTLKKALKYNRENPIAHYRLGFLTYKERNYVEATVHFQNAVHYQETCSNKEYRLNQQQNYNAHLYLSNSALYIAQETQKSLEKLQGDVNREGVPNLEMSPLYEMIKQNEGYLLSHAFTAITQMDTKKYSKGKCEEIVSSELQDTIILYFSDRQHSLFYNGREEVLSINHAEMLRYFLLHSTEEDLVTKDKFYDLFQSVDQNGEVPNNTYTQAVNRLRRKLVQCGVPSSVIENKAYNGQPAYYFTQTLPFLIMHRSDEMFILN